MLLMCHDFVLQPPIPQSDSGIPEVLVCFSHHCDPWGMMPLFCVVCDLWCSLFVPQDFRRLLKKEEKPLLMMFYAPCE